MGFNKKAQECANPIAISRSSYRNHETKRGVGRLEKIGGFGFSVVIVAVIVTCFIVNTKSFYFALEKELIVRTA